jgi:hypothetical protein
MIQSPKSPLRDFPTSTIPPKSIPVNNSKNRDRSDSDLSTSLVSNDSSIFDHMPTSDPSSSPLSLPSDSEENEVVDYKYHPPRISSKTYMQQTAETIEEDPDEDSENGEIAGDANHPGVHVSEPSPDRSSSRPSTPLNLRLNTENLNNDDQPVEIKHHFTASSQNKDKLPVVANGSAKSSVTNSPESAHATPPATSATSPSVPLGTPLASAKKEKSFFRLPKLHRSKSQAELPAESKTSLKDTIKHVFSTANNSVTSVSKTPPDSKSNSAPGTPQMTMAIPTSQPSPDGNAELPPPSRIKVPVVSPPSVRI